MFRCPMIQKGERALDQKGDKIGNKEVIGDHNDIIVRDQADN